MNAPAEAEGFAVVVVVVFVVVVLEVAVVEVVVVVVVVVLPVLGRYVRVAGQLFTVPPVFSVSGCCSISYMLEHSQGKRTGAGICRFELAGLDTAL